MLLTKEHQEALLDAYFNKGISLRTDEIFLEGVIVGIKLHQKHLKDSENGK
jgi:hypothetical protein